MKDLDIEAVPEPLDDLAPSKRSAPGRVAVLGAAPSTASRY
ncbi:hypothetical protein [Nocardia sp. NPDC051463]